MILGRQPLPHTADPGSRPQLGPGSHWEAPWDKLLLKNKGWCLKGDKGALGKYLLAGRASWGVPEGRCKQRGVRLSGPNPGDMS